MFFSLVLYFILQTVDAAVSDPVVLVQNETIFVELDTRKSNEGTALTEQSNKDQLCSELNGRSMFRAANIGGTLGVLLTLGSVVVVLDGIDSASTPSMVIPGVAGVGMLVGSLIKLPISVHKLHRDALRKGYTPIFSEEALFSFDTLIVLGFISGVIVPYAILMIPAGYTMLELHGLDIVREVRKEQERVCGKSF